MNTTSDATPAAAANGQRRRILTIVATVFAVAALSWFVLWYVVLSEREQTDDAYVNGNQVSVTSQIAGTVVGVYANNTDLVGAGQVLVRLDPTDAQTALERATSALAQAVRQVRQQQAQAGQYDAQIVRSRLELARAEEDLARRSPLLADQAIASEEVKHAEAAVAMARANLAQVQRQADSAHALVDGVSVRDNPAVQAARAAYRDAYVNASRNAIVSPVAGFVALRSVQLGQRIQAGAPLLDVVPLQSLWVDANFKEGQLRNLRLGQPTAVRSDLYGGGVTFHGKVIGMAAGTGAAFSLLPAQNASGNWIKVVQRVPVRISIAPEELARHPLRIGLSTTVTVDTHERGGPMLAAVPAAGPGASTTVYAADLARADAEANAIIARNLGGAR
ncbi:MAG: efflux RND transporter periplasmic adaptor subunit [Gammaproteobacteria bacterium]|nr:efflux RND transporter periplasmic adaptor subunit [Gammaproteobacteria bacterium]MDE2249966.1 efflux RND transporter periplasmic adaptor subunit [Gammaproteobacteria bacterium]